MYYIVTFQTNNFRTNLIILRKNPRRLERRGLENCQQIYITTIIGSSLLPIQVLKHIIINSCFPGETCGMRYKYRVVYQQKYLYRVLYQVVVIGTIAPGTSYLPYTGLERRSRGSGMGRVVFVSCRAIVSVAFLDTRRSTTVILQFYLWLAFPH